MSDSRECGEEIAVVDSALKNILGRRPADEERAAELPVLRRRHRFWMVQPQEPFIDKVFELDAAAAGREVAKCGALVTAVRRIVADDVGRQLSHRVGHGERHCARAGGYHRGEVVVFGRRHDVIAGNFGEQFEHVNAVQRSVRG